MKKYFMMLAVVVAMVAGVSLNAGAETLLIDEDFQTNPLLAQRTVLINQDPNPFPGWRYQTQYVQAVRSNGYSSNAIIGPRSGANVNQGLRHEWNAWIRFDTGHEWSTDEPGYSLSFNAMPRRWNGATSNRRVRVRLFETETGTEVWSSGVIDLPRWDAALDNFNLTEWPEELTFNFDFGPGDFTGGTPGEALTFEFADVGDRGVYYDNITLALLPVPPPAGTVMMIK